MSYAAALLKCRISGVLPRGERPFGLEKPRTVDAEKALLGRDRFRAGVDLDRLAEGDSRRPQMQLISGADMPGELNYLSGKRLFPNVRKAVEHYKTLCGIDKASAVFLADDGTTIEADQLGQLASARSPQARLE